MTPLEEAGTALARVLGLDPQHRLCWGLSCDFDSGDVARLRELRDELRETFPDLADTVGRHLHMVQHACELLNEASPDERMARREALWPMPPSSGPDLSALCDYLLDVLPMLERSEKGVGQEDRARLMRTLIKASFLDLGTCVGDGRVPVACDKAVLAHYGDRLRMLVLDLSSSRLTHSGDFEGAMKVLAQSAAYGFGVDGVGVWLLDAARNRALRVVHFSPGSEIELNGVSHAIGELPFSLDRLLAPHASALGPRSLSAHKGRIYSLRDGNPAGAVLLAPIRIGTRLEGFLALEHASDRLWTAEDQRYAEELARIAAIALEARERRRAYALLNLQVSALNSIPSMMLLVGRDGRIEWANLAFEQVSGYPPSELQGRPLSVLRTCKEKGTVYRELWERARAGQVWRGKVAWQTRDRRIVNRRIAMLPLRDVSGSVSHILVMEEHLPRKSLRRAVWKLAVRGLAAIPRRG